MKMRLLVALVELAISFALPTFAQQKDTVDPKIAQQIHALMAKWDEGFNRSDSGALAALYTDDGVWVSCARNISRSGRPSQKSIQNAPSGNAKATTMS